MRYFQNKGDFMFKRSGFLFIEVLMGLFLLGVIVVSCLPLISTSLENIRLTKMKAEMVFIAESAMEKMLNYNSLYPYEEYIFDTTVDELMDKFKKNDKITIDLPLEDDDNWNYFLRISKNNINDKLWNILIEISPRKEEKKIENVILQSIVPIES